MANAEHRVFPCCRGMRAGSQGYPMATAGSPIGGHEVASGGRPKFNSVVRFLLLASFLTTMACGEEPEPCEPMGPPSLEVGVPDSITFLDFEPLSEGGDIPLSSNGQTFLAVQVAVRAQNVLEIADVTLRVSSRAMGTMSESTTTERLRCRTDNLRYLVPVVVSSEDLGPDLDVQDSEVDIELELVDSDGNRATATSNGILRRL